MPDLAFIHLGRVVAPPLFLTRRDWVVFGPLPLRGELSVTWDKHVGPQVQMTPTLTAAERDCAYEVLCYFKAQGDTFTTPAMLTAFLTTQEYVDRTPPLSTPLSRHRCAYSRRQMYDTTHAAVVGTGVMDQAAYHQIFIKGLGL